MVDVARVFADKRAIVIALGVIAAANLVTLGLVVGPLRSRVHTLTDRATAVSLEAAAAQRELDAARLTATGSARAGTDLQRFYSEILPADHAAARQLTFLQVAQLARDTNLTYDRRAFSQESVEKGALVRANLDMQVSGSYGDLRRFLYRVETGDPFVVVRRIAVERPDEPGAPLEASLNLATYFRPGDGR